MKFTMFLIALLFGFSASATEVPGKIFYKTKSGEIVKRAVTLEVPSKGQGDVILRGESFEWKSQNFWTTRASSGEVTFTTAFATEFMDKKSIIALDGTYLKADNKIIYYGSFYKKKGDSMNEKDISDFDYQGGFKFVYERD